MRVLNLVTTSSFAPYEQQVEILRQQGIRETTLAVPAERRVTDEGISSRSWTDYLRLYLQSLRHSFGNYDVVHANYGLTLPLALAQPTLPVVVTLWGSDLLGKYGRVVAACTRRADEVVVRSDEMDDALPMDAHVIPQGVDLQLFRPIPQADARRAVGWTRDANHVLFPYSVTRDVKNYPRAKRVIAQLDREISGTVELQTVSNVPHEQMPLYLNAADVLLLTSTHEGSPNTVKEAMACNVPVVSTDVGDVRQRLSSVQPSHTGRTDAELVDGLRDVLQRETHSNGRAAIENLSLERMGERLRDVYELAR